MQRFQLLVFDWDGTLADSAALIVSMMQQAIQALDLAPRSDAAIRELIGLGLIDGLGRLYPDEPLQRLEGAVQAYRSRFFSSVDAEPPLFDGVTATLELLAAQGRLLGVATGKSRRGLDRALQHHGLRGHFAATRTADQTAPKPDPQMLRELLDELGCAPQHALMIGDTEYDAQMAAALGVTMLGVSCGVHDAERMLGAGASEVIDSVASLPRWLASR